MRFPWRFGLVAALLLFLFFGDAPASSRFWNAFLDAGHTALFGVIALVVYYWVASRRRGASALSNGLAAFAITVILGALTEVLQTFQARGDPSVTDLLRDAAGAGAFLLIAWVVSTWRKHWTSARLAAVVVAVVLLASAGWTLMRTTACYAARDNAYPTLFNLDGSWWESEFLDLGQNRLTPGVRTMPGGERQDVRLSRLDLAPGRYSGITFDEPYPDWRGRDALALTIVSDLDQALPMAIRVHDASHDQRLRDRFNRSFNIVPGVNRLRIPLEDIRNAPDRRKMDMARIRGVILFAFDLKKPASLFVGPLRLE
jgi:VanZ family protein